MADPKLVVLVHGWSVTDLGTYGELPARLEAEAGAAGLPLRLENVLLSKYVSFRDEVRLEDIARGFHAAVTEQVLPRLTSGGRFACITHSTGGPVVRDWWHRYHLRKGVACPMSHLVMLAPANFGSALAQLGKGKLSRIRSWFHGVEPGTGVLEWLELGSPESWSLNDEWIDTPDVTQEGRTPGVYPFVLTGQSIDRKLYDHVNSYTGEVGSDGVVRVAAANLNATRLRLQQDAREGDALTTLSVEGPKRSQPSAFRIIEGRSHSAEDMGILASIKNDRKPHPTVDAILRCLAVADADGYAKLREAFDLENVTVIDRERVEPPKQGLLRSDHYEIHDQHSMLIFRITDDRGHIVEEFDLVLTGPGNDANLLPTGFLTDRQRNQRHRGTVTFFVNTDLMNGTPALLSGSEVLRRAIAPVEQLGFEVDPHQSAADRFVRYARAAISASRERLDAVLRPNETTLVDVVLRRIVGRGVFGFAQKGDDPDFHTTKPGRPIPFE